MPLFRMILTRRADDTFEVIYSMYATIWSLLPFAVVIPVSMLTKQVIPGLVAGLIVGAFERTPTIMGTIDTALRYLFTELTMSGNIHLLLFLYLFGAFIGIVRVTGGVKGLAHWLSPRIHSAKTAFAVTWLSSFGTFMAPDFRIIAIAPIMRPLIKKLGISPERLAYIIDVTATPLIAIIPIGTAFVGYMVGLIATSLRHNGLSIAPYPFFLSTIALNFFSIIILLMAFYSSFFVKSVQPANVRMRLSHIPRQEWQLETGKLDDASAKLENVRVAQKAQSVIPEEPLELLSDQATPAVSHLVVPIALLLFFTFFLTWWDGHLKASGLFNVLMKADASKAMLQAVFVTLILSVIFYMLRRQAIDRIMYGVVSGGNEMMPVLVLLALVWAVSAISTDLGFSAYVAKTIGGVVPRQFIAPALFVFGSVISYFIGSSFGTWGILLPLGFSLAASTHASLPLIAGAVFASGTLGGFASPLSDNTVAMATVMKLPVMGFSRRLLKPTLVAGGIAAAGYTVAGFLL